MVGGHVRRALVGLAAAVVAWSCSPQSTPTPGAGSTAYQDLVALFRDWRAFQQPRTSPDGAPDYSTSAMEAQYRALDDYRSRLDRIDPGGWPVPQQVDYQLVLAEMNGLDFDHRVLRPWARNPAFYVQVFPSQSDVPAREGPHASAAIELWTYRFPLDDSSATRLVAQVRSIPPLLAHARVNLVEDARDLWVAGVRAMREQSDDLEALRSRLGDTHPDLAAAVQQAREATDAFRAWLETETPALRSPSGVGIENYNWYQRNVHFLPYTWQEEVTLMRRELARAHAFLRLEEHRNRRLPPLAPVASAAEYDRRFNAAVTEYMA
ncbi:MAG TPA: DUF885 family protein, partial [Gemmatimonadales bacterium]|nr:DUF885 family protein [Gemmatimonadales bacterium]